MISVVAVCSHEPVVVAAFSAGTYEAPIVDLQHFAAWQLLGVAEAMHVDYQPPAGCERWDAWLGTGGLSDFHRQQQVGHTRKAWIDEGIATTARMRLLLFQEEKQLLQKYKLCQDKSRTGLVAMMALEAAKAADGASSSSSGGGNGGWKRWFKRQPQTVTPICYSSNNNRDDDSSEDQRNHSAVICITDEVTPMT